MRKNLLKSFSFTLALLLLLGTLSVPLSAIDFKKGTNTASESYRSGIYYKNLISLPDTRDSRTDVLAVALSQLGYTEGNENGAFSGTIAGGTGNYTEYNYNMGSFGSGYGGAEYPWCASFVSFCLLQSGCHTQSSISDWCRKNEGDPEHIWREVSCNKWATQLRTCGYFENSVHFGGSYEPIPGDLIFFTSNGVTESHIGFVLYVNGPTVYTVEGNTSSAQGLETNGGGVYVKSYSLSSSYIRGYGLLPYTANNSVCKIDYSGEKPTEGLYVATTAKYVYPTENSATYNAVLPKYSLFKVTEIASNGRLKMTYEANGSTLTGYVKNNSDRVIQISSDKASESYPTLSSVWGYKGSEIIGYTVAEKEIAPSLMKDETELIFGDAFGIKGSVGFSRKIAGIGYYFDSNRTDVTWLDSSSLTQNSSLSSTLGKHAVSYTATADLSTLSAGKHSVSFVIKLSDNEISLIKTLDVIIRNKNNTVPASPEIASFTDNSITLKHFDGYEYGLGDGAWQSSPTFEWLDAEQSYSFIQRIAMTDTALASVGSEPLTVDFKKLLLSNKLASLNIENATLSPSFDPEVLEYSVSVPNSTEKLKISAEANEGATVDISSAELTEGKQTQILITVTPSVGNAIVYKINAFREVSATETTAPIETETTQAVTESEYDSETTLPETTESVLIETEAEYPDSESDEADTASSCTSSIFNIKTAVLFTISICLSASFVSKKHDE